MSMNRDMMAQIGQMAQRMQAAQAELAEKRAEGTSGGGAVTVVLTGGMKVESLRLNQDVVDPEDVDPRPREPDRLAAGAAAHVEQTTARRQVTLEQDLLLREQLGLAADHLRFRVVGGGEARQHLVLGTHEQRREEWMA